MTPEMLYATTTRSYAEQVMDFLGVIQKNSDRIKLLTIESNPNKLLQHVDSKRLANVGSLRDIAHEYLFGSVKYDPTNSQDLLENYFNGIHMDENFINAPKTTDGLDVRTFANAKLVVHQFHGVVELLTWSRMRKDDLFGRLDEIIVECACALYDLTAYMADIFSNHSPQIADNPFMMHTVQVNFSVEELQKQREAEERRIALEEERQRRQEEMDRCASLVKEFENDLQTSNVQYDFRNYSFNELIDLKEFIYKFLHTKLADLVNVVREMVKNHQEEKLLTEVDIDYADLVNAINGSIDNVNEILTFAVPECASVSIATRHQETLSDITSNYLGVYSFSLKIIEK